MTVETLWSTSVRGTACPWQDHGDEAQTNTNIADIRVLTSFLELRQPTLSSVVVLQFYNLMATDGVLNLFTSTCVLYFYAFALAALRRG